jgi:glycosyltransferase involved in cell wall biosynthesis
MNKLSVVLSTRNEASNIGPCLESVKNIANEIIVFDESSKDNTREIARSYGASVFKVEHEPIFHKTKQKALDKASGNWILQLDADERVSPPLAREIKEVINLSDKEMMERKLKDKRKLELFNRHQRLVEARDGKLGNGSGEVVAFFIPRRNFFLGKPLIHAGVYPDAVIRLIKKGKAGLPAKSVHEQMWINGDIAWLFNDLEHHDSPTFSRYIYRLNRYTDLKAEEFEKAKTPKNIFTLFYYSFVKPLTVFSVLYFRHKGILDGPRGFVWSMFSATHFPIAYYKYFTNRRV